MATKPGWGAVEWYSAADGYKNPVNRGRSDKTQQLCCDEDTSASLYTKNGGYFGIFPYEEINVKEMPKQAEVAAIIYSDSCGYSIWAEDFNQIHFFVHGPFPLLSVFLRDFPGIRVNNCWMCIFKEHTFFGRITGDFFALE